MIVRKGVSLFPLVVLLIAASLTACGGGAGGGTGGGGGAGGGGGTNPPPNTANEWTWMGGSDTGDAVGAYGTQGTAASTNVPGARIGAASWADESGNFWLFGGTGYASTSAGASGYLNDLWEYDTAANTWTWQSGSDTPGASGVYGTMGAAAPGNVPGSRYEAASWTDSAGNLWLFGGQGKGPSGTSDFSDLWEFNSIAKEWTWVAGSSVVNAAGVYGTLGTPSTSNAPGARMGAVAWTDGSGNLWLFGGEAPNGQPLNDLWEFQPSAKTWTWVSGSDVANAAAVYGTQGAPASGNVPGARWGSSGWIGSNGNLWLFGGSDSLFLSDLNDLWEFNPATKYWAWVSGTNGHGIEAGVYGTEGLDSSANTPGSRGLAVSWADKSGNLWLFGGQGYGSSASLNGDLGDLWKFNVSASEWTWVEGSSAASTQAAAVYGTIGVAAPTNYPGPRDSAVGWSDSSGNLWLFGGQVVPYFNDLWRYEP